MHFFFNSKFYKLCCSQHSSEFICRECKMVSENFLVAHTLLFYNYSHYFFFKKHYSHCFFRSMKHLTQASHPYLERETTKRAKKMMEETDKKIKNVRNICINLYHKPRQLFNYLLFFLTHSFQWTYSTLILVVTSNSCISTCASDSTLFLNNFRWATNPNIRKEDDGEFQK